MPLHILLLFLLVAPLLAASPQNTADSLLRCSADYFKKNESFKFEFNMLYRASATGEESVRKGSVLTGSENNFAIKLPDQQIISDGINLWQYNPVQKQVLVKLIADLENNLHPTELIFRYLGTKAVSAKTELWKGAAVNALTLNPDKYREQFSAMEVWISPRDCSPLRLHTIDNLGNEVWYSIENLTAVKLSRDDFKFKLPLGVEEIDLR